MSPVEKEEIVQAFQRQLREIWERVPRPITSSFGDFWLDALEALSKER